MAGSLDIFSGDSYTDRRALKPVAQYVRTAAGVWVPMVGDASGNIGTTVAAGSAIIGKVQIDQTTPGTTNGVKVNAGEAHVGQVGGTTPLVTGSFTRLDEATVGAYAAGDMIANSTTAASVVPITFTVGRASAAIVSGRISGCRCVVTPASSNLVIAALDFDLLLFRPNTNIPFAAAGYPADNAALAVSPAAMEDLVAVFSFVNTGWRSPAGSVSVAGIAGRQAVIAASGRPFATFNLSDLGAATTLLGILQAQGIWNPGHVNQRFQFALDTDLD